MGASVSPLHSEALTVAIEVDVHMTKLTNSLVPLVIVWCYEGGLSFCAKKFCTLRLRVQQRERERQREGTDNIFSGYHFTICKLLNRPRN